MTRLPLPSEIGTSIVVFASTNLDDIVLLAVFFADPAFRVRSIVAGQFLGIGVLVLGSALGALLTAAAPPGWASLLGVLPLALGLFKLGGLVRTRFAPLPDDPPEEASSSTARVQAFAVAGVTIANGGDNLSVYLPLFAADRSLLVGHITVFAVLTGLWCAAGYWMVHNPLFGERLRRYGRLVLPFVLIALGLHVLSGARHLVL